MKIFTLKFRRSLLLITLFIASWQLIMAQAPTITSFSPTSACSGSGINDTIFGTNLSNAFDVSFNGTSASIIYNSDDTVIVTLPNGATTGFITYTNYNGVDTSSTVFTVDQSPMPSITGATNACTGDSIKLKTGSYASYLWSTSATADSIYAHTSGIYSVTVTDTNGCMGSASSTLTFGTHLTPVISGTLSFCAGDSSLLSVGMYNHYIWNNNDTTSSFYAHNSGTYSVTVTNHTGCTGTASIIVTVNANPTPTITHSGSTTFCMGGSVTLDAGTYSSYNWNTGSNSSSISADTAGTYMVTVTNVNGCTGTASQVVTVNPLPTPTITPSGATSFCQGGSVSLNAGSGYTSYHWNNGATTQSVTSSVSYDYVVSVTNSNGCVGTATQTVTVNPAPVTIVTVNGPTTFCAGGSVMLDAGSFSSYNWSNGATTETISATTTGTYTVTVTNGFGCTASASSSAITVNALPIVTITGATSICTGDSTLILHSSITETSYMWNTGATMDSIHVYNSGTYTITVTDANGCMNNASKTVIVDSILHPSITGMTAICAGTNDILDAGIYTTYHWNSGNATTETITRDTAGTYIVTVHNGTTCHGTDTFTVIVNPTPTPMITSNGPDTFCAGGSVTLDAGVFTSYHWNMNNDTLETNMATVNGNYTVTVTDANGCTKSVSKAVDVIPLPPPFSIYILSNELFSSSYTHNQWYRNDTLIAGATGQSYNPTRTGVYTDIITINGCSTVSSDSIVITQLGVGINEVSSDNHFELFPNPTNGNLNLLYHLSASSVVELRISDVIGRTVFSYQIKGMMGTEVMDISILSKGIYYWEAVSDNKVLDKGKIAVIK